MTDTVSRWEALGAQVSCAVERQGGRGEGSTGQRIVWRPHQAELGVGGSQSPERGAAGNQRAENGRSRSRGAGSLAGDQFHWQHGQSLQARTARVMEQLTLKPPRGGPDCRHLGTSSCEGQRLNGEGRVVSHSLKREELKIWETLQSGGWEKGQGGSPGSGMSRLLH